MGDQINEDEHRLVCSQKDDLYRIMISNNYWVPDLGTRACTLDFLIGIRNYQTFWTPRNEHGINVMRPRVKVSLKDLAHLSVMGLVEHSIKASNQVIKPQILNTASLLETHAADELFYLGLLSVVFPDCRIFEKNYKGERIREVEQRKIDNRDGLYTNVPTLNAKKLKGRNTVLNKITPGMTKLEKLKIRQEQINERIKQEKEAQEEKKEKNKDDKEALKRFKEEQLKQQQQWEKQAAEQARALADVQRQLKEQQVAYERQNQYIQQMQQNQQQNQNAQALMSAQQLPQSSSSQFNSAQQQPANGLSSLQRGLNQVVISDPKPVGMFHSPSIPPNNPIPTPTRSKRAAADKAMQQIQGLNKGADWGGNQ